MKRIWVERAIVVGAALLVAIVLVVVARLTNYEPPEDHYRATSRLERGQ